MIRCIIGRVGMFIVLFVLGLLTIIKQKNNRGK